MVEVRLTREQCEDAIIQYINSRLDFTKEGKLVFDHWKDWYDPSGAVLSVIKEDG